MDGIGSFTGQLKKGLRLCGLPTEVTLGSLPTSSLELRHVVQFLPFNATDRSHTSPTRLATHRLPSKYCPPNQSDVDIFSLKFRCGHFVSCSRLASVALSSSGAVSLMCHEVSLESLTTFDLIWSHNVQNRQQLFLCCRFFHKKQQQRPCRPAGPALCRCPGRAWRCNRNARPALPG